MFARSRTLTPVSLYPFVLSLPQFPQTLTLKPVPLGKTERERESAGEAEQSRQ